MASHWWCSLCKAETKWSVYANGKPCACLQCGCKPAKRLQVVRSRNEASGHQPRERGGSEGVNGRHENRVD